MVTIAGVAGGLRLGFALWSGRFWKPEVWEYEQIATALLQGRGFLFEWHQTPYRSYCEPLYPLLAAGVYWLTEHRQSALVVVQIILSSLTAVMAASCAWHLTQRREAVWLAGLLVAGHPGLILYTTKLHPFVLDALGFTLVAWALLRYADHPTPQGALRLGLVGGLCLLTRPTVLVLLPLGGWWIWRATEGDRMVQIRRVALVLVVIGLLISPWVVRNIHLHGRFMLTRSTAPFMLWLGNNPRATGSALTPQGRPIFELAPRPFQEAIVASDELGRQALFAQAAWAYIRSDPWAFVKRTLQKVGYFWWFSPSAGQLYPQRWWRLYQLWWAGLLLLGLWGMIEARVLPMALRQRLWLLVGMALLLSLAQSVFYVEGRHRLAVEPLFSGVIAFGAMQLWVRWTTRPGNVSTRCGR